MPGDTYVCPHTCKVPSISEKSSVPKSLSSTQSQMPNRNFIVATATLVPVTFCFHNSVLLCFILNDSAFLCFILNDTFDMFQQQETLMSDKQILDRTNTSNNREQSLVQTRAHVRINALAPSSRHGLCGYWNKDSMAKNIFSKYVL